MKNLSYLIFYLSFKSFNLVRRVIGGFGSMLKIRDVHRLGKPNKPDQIDSKKKWIRSGKWVNMVFKKVKPFKLIGFRLNPNPTHKNYKTQKLKRHCQKMGKF